MTFRIFTISTLIIILFLSPTHAYEVKYEKTFLEKTQKFLGFPSYKQNYHDGMAGLQNVKNVILVIESLKYSDSKTHDQLVAYIGSKEFKNYVTQQFMNGRFDLEDFYFLHRKEIFEPQYYSLLQEESTLLINMEFTVQERPEGTTVVSGVSYGRYKIPSAALKTTYSSYPLKNGSFEEIKKNLHLRVISNAKNSPNILN